MRLVLISSAILSTACGYGFENRQFGEMKRTAVAFAQAMAAGDSARMRQLSWGTVQANIPAILRETPAAYTQFSTPSPEILTVQGGGIYGGSAGAEFLLASKRLGDCHGGVRVMVLMLGNVPRIAAIRLVPALDSVTTESCRTSLNDS